MKQLHWILWVLIVPFLCVSSSSATSLSSAGAAVNFDGGVCQSTKTFTQADIYAWHTTPLLLVPAPPVGKVIRPVSLHATYDPATTRYLLTSNPTLYVGTVALGTSPQIETLFAATPAYPHVYDTTLQAGPGVLTLTGMANGTVTLHNADAIVAGDGNVIIVTQYYILNGDGSFSTTGCPGTNPIPSIQTVSAHPVVEVAAMAYDSQYCGCTGSISANPTGAACGNGGSLSSLWTCWLENIIGTGGFQSHTTYHFQSGYYNVTGTLLATGIGTHLVGDGMFVTVLVDNRSQAAITSSNAAIRYWSGCTAATTSDHCTPVKFGSIQNMELLNNHYGGDFHIAVDLVDAQEFAMRNVAIINYQSCSRSFPGHELNDPECLFTLYTGESIGIQVRGREGFVFDNVHIIFADRPIVVGMNPAYVRSDSPLERGGIDLATFSNMYLEGNSTIAPLFDILSRADRTTIGGYGAWVGNCGAFRWKNDDMYIAAGLLVIKELGYEQGVHKGTFDCTQPWNILIDVGASNGGLLRNVNIVSYDGSAGDGFKFRNVSAVMLQSTYFNSSADPGTGRVCIDVDSTVETVTLNGTKWLTGNTSNFSPLSKTFGTAVPAGMCAPSTGAYEQ